MRSVRQNRAQTGEFVKVAKVIWAGRVAPAVLDGDTARIVGEWADTPPLATWFGSPALSLKELTQLSESAIERIPIADVRLASPINPLSKLICLGFNYRNHVEETRANAPEFPALFTKLPDALVGHDECIVRPLASEQFDYEGEISVVIGTGGRHIRSQDALTHVFGYTIMLDGSVRDFQKHSPSAGKNFWRSGSIGPYIVTADEIPDPRLFRLETRLNGVTVQQTTADLMLYDIATVIAYISRFTTLAPGDIIATGTPGGVGSRRTPPLWMKAEDTIEVDVSGIGTLRNTVIDEK